MATKDRAAITVRPARLADIDQIREISAYYVENTVINFMYRPASKESLEATLAATKDRNLPYLVATEADSTSGTTTSLHNEFTSSSNNEDNNTNESSSNNNDNNETILGYIYVGPFPSTRLAYAHTLELSIFTHPHLGRQKGIGSALLHTLLEHLRTNKHHAFEPGFERERRSAYARKLVAKMSYDTNGPNSSRQASETLRQWYAKWGFTEVGIMKDVGYKFGRYVDTMDHILDLDQYYKSIGASIDDRAEP